MKKNSNRLDKGRQARPALQKGLQMKNKAYSLQDVREIAIKEKRKAERARREAARAFQRHEIGLTEFLLYDGTFEALADRWDKVISAIAV